MLNAKVLRDWFMIFLLLLFLPAENRLVVFDMKPEDWYGEIKITAGTETVIVAKNSYADKVFIGLPGHPNILALQSNRKEGFLLKDPAHALPESLMVITTDNSVSPPEQRQKALLKDNYYFDPGPLGVFTQSDLYRVYLLAGILAGGFIMLGFSLARFGFEGNVEQKDK